MQIGCAECSPLMSALSLPGTGDVPSWHRHSAINLGQFSISLVKLERELLLLEGTDHREQQPKSPLKQPCPSSRKFRTKGLRLPAVIPYPHSGLGWFKPNKWLKDKDPPSAKQFERVLSAQLSPAWCRIEAVLCQERSDVPSLPCLTADISAAWWAWTALITNHKYF